MFRHVVLHQDKYDRKTMNLENIVTRLARECCLNVLRTLGFRIGNVVIQRFNIANFSTPWNVQNNVMSLHYHNLFTTFRRLKSIAWNKKK